MMRRNCGAIAAAARRQLPSLTRPTAATSTSATSLTQIRTSYYKKNAYRNKWSEFFFTEFDKGFGSPYFVVVFFSGVVVFTYKLFYDYLIPTYEAGRLKQSSSWQMRVPFVDSHNAFWNMKPAEADARHPSSLVMMDEEIVKQPGLIATVDSELRTPNGEKKSIFVMETQELDHGHNDDVFYRTINYVNESELRPAPGKENAKHRRQQRYDTDASGTPITSGYDREQEDHIHAMVKCRTVTDTNQCVPETQAIVEELQRKLFLGIVPLYFLRDYYAVTGPRRFTLAGQPEQHCAIFGLKGGNLCRAMSTAFPFIKLHVVEPDAGLVKANRQFLGLKESDGLKVFADDYQSFVKNAHVSGNKYDMIIIDGEDSRGRVSTNFGRLEFVDQLQSILGPRGCLVINVPNKIRRETEAMIDNWRLAFPQQALTLIHCRTSRNTVMMAFKSHAEFGQQVIGSIPDAKTFQDFYLAKRSQFNRSMDQDVAAEVGDDNYQCIMPDQKYHLLLDFPDDPAEEMNKKRIAEMGGSGASKDSLGSGFVPQHATPTPVGEQGFLGKIKNHVGL